MKFIKKVINIIVDVFIISIIALGVILLFKIKIPIDEMIKSFEEVLERGSFDEIRYLLTSLIDRIDLNDEDVTIHWNF